MKNFVYNMYYYNVNYIAILIIQIKLFKFFNNKNFLTINVE